MDRTPLLIAIQPDDYGPGDASSPLWTELLVQAGHQVREVDVFSADILERLHGCQAFMWRHIHLPDHRQIARRLLPVIERELGLVVYPDQNTCWHYDDKIAQAYLFEAAGIPAPKSWIWYDRDKALDWARRAQYPLVLKLASGAGSTNVQLVRSAAQARDWIVRLFAAGVQGLEAQGGLRQALYRQFHLHPMHPGAPHWEVHKNYVFFQEFLPGNDFDIRVTVIGDRAFGFRRFNRQDDFRASGSGMIDYEPAHVDKNMVRLAFQVADKLAMQSCAIDGLFSNGEPVVGEVSYTYASWAVHSCPGHWDRELKWHPGQMWPEQAQVEDLLARLEERTP